MPVPGLFISLYSLFWLLINALDETDVLELDV